MGNRKIIFNGVDITDVIVHLGFQEQVVTHSSVLTNSIESYPGSAVLDMTIDSPDYLVKDNEEHLTTPHFDRHTETLYVVRVADQWDEHWSIDRIFYDSKQANEYADILRTVDEDRDVNVSKFETTARNVTFAKEYTLTGYIVDNYLVYQVESRVTDASPEHHMTLKSKHWSVEATSTDEDLLMATVTAWAESRGFIIMEEEAYRDASSSE